MNEICFEDGEVVVNDRDSIGSLSFSSGNAQYRGVNFSLLANSSLLVSGYSDSLVSLVEFDTDPFRKENIEDGYFGAQVILPIDSTTIVYVSETLFSGDLTSAVWFVMPGFASAFLLIDSLNKNSNNVQSRSNFLTNTGDSLIWRVLEHTSNPRGGWWGVSKSSVSNRYQKWIISNDTIHLQTPQNIGSRGEYDEGTLVDITFRPAGDAFAISGSDNGLDLYYFNRNTGEMSVWAEINSSYDPDFEPYTVATRCEWSADGRYLYVTNERKLYQFDTEAFDIEASAVQINDPDNIPFRGSYYQIERGPDCRLYVARSGTGKTLSVIDKPSRPGRACELKDSGLLLPNYYFVSIPEFPEYSLWAKDRVARGLAPIIDTAVCDSSIHAYDYFDWTTSTIEVLVEAETITISPNPARGGEVLSIDYELPSALHSELNMSLKASLYSLSGQKMGNIELLSIDEYRAQVQLPDGVPAGVYRLLIASSEIPLLGGKVMVQ